MIEQRRISKEQACGILGISESELAIARKRAVKGDGRIASSIRLDVDLYFVRSGNSGYYELVGEQSHIDYVIVNGFGE